MNQQENKKIYRPKIAGQKTKLVGWPRYYKKECPVKKSLWQTIRAMLF
jgi:hypothetical protein